MKESTASTAIPRLSMAIVLAFMALNAGAQTPNTNTNGYWVNSSGQVWKNNYGECWRAGYWTPAMAIAECDPGLMPKVAQAPVAPPPSVIAPPPKPAVVAPRPAPPVPVTEKVTLQADALFDFDKSVIRPDAKASLDDLIAKLKAVNLVVVIVVGHTDRIGSDAYNMSLSARRAESVKQYFISRGIAGNRIQSEGRGESQPVKDCKETKRGPLIACLQPNRRVQVEVIGTRNR
jgi:OOP family OmpA-OmpF porin